MPHLTPLPGQAKHVGPYLPPYQAPKKVKSGTWAKLVHGFPGTSFPDTAQLLTDGTVLMHDGCTPDWYKLTPDSKGSYHNGTWTKVASMSASYGPLYFASEVLPDGRLIVNGGEYNFCNGVWTNLGALYDPAANSWTSVTAPTGWSKIGDAQSAVLPNGQYMLANCCTSQNAIASISGTTVTFTSTGTGKADINDEEGWTILPNNTIETVDANRNLGGSSNNTENYDPNTGAWTTKNNTCNQVVDPGSHEVGPLPLMPNGKAFQFGATVHTDIYDPLTDGWTCGPDMPGVDSADGPAAVLPDGNVLAQLSPGVFNTPSHFYEVNVKVKKSGKTKVKMVQVNEPADAPLDSSYDGRLLMLPTGEAFWPSDSGDIEIYTPQGSPDKNSVPTITSSPGSVSRGSTNNVIQGTLFNGLTQGGYYGDDAQASTNYPLVRITNNSTGDVCYAKTHSHSSMGISTVGNPTSTQFDVPNSCETGASTVQVVVNGIASAAANITVN